MRLEHILLAALAFFSGAEAARKPSNSVLLSNVQSLTLRKGLKTSHRRVSVVPQLNCVGGNAKGLYEVDVMRCKNAGSDYDDDNIQWTCTASLPEEFKLGSTDVICEGYDSPNDPYILKGSCGVEYRLVLTAKGEEKYGKNTGSDKEENFTKTPGEKVFEKLFWIIFIGVIIWMLVSACGGRGGDPQRPDAGRPGFGGGGGGWGGDDDPPPPYDAHYRPPSKPRTSQGSTQQQAWQPGFWSGAGAGAAAGYAAGRYGGRGNTNSSGRGGNTGGSSWSGNGEGSSRSGSGSSSGSSSTRYESTGFGSTSRR